MQKGSGYYQPPGNQMVYSQQIQQLPNLSSQQNTLMQGPMQAQGRPAYVASADTHTMRPIVGSGMPIGSYAGPGQATEVAPGYQSHAYHVPTQTQFMPNSIQQYTTYGNANYIPRNSQYPVYVVHQQGVHQQGVVQPGNYANNVVLAPQISATSQAHQIPSQPQPQQQQQQQPQQHLYTSMPANSMGAVHASQPAPVIQQAEVPLQKKRTTIKLTDPNTGKDLTSEILTKKKTSASKKVNPDESIKAKTAALFAAQVAKKIAGSAQTEPENKAITIKPSTPTTVPVAEEKLAVPVNEGEDVADDTNNLPVVTKEIPTSAEVDVDVKPATSVSLPESSVQPDNITAESTCEDGHPPVDIKASTDIVVQDAGVDVVIKDVDGVDGEVTPHQDNVTVTKDDAVVVEDAIVLKDDAVLVADIVDKVHQMELQQEIDISLKNADKIQEVINNVKNLEINVEMKIVETVVKPAEVISDDSAKQCPGKDVVDKIAPAKPAKEVIEVESVKKDEAVMEAPPPTAAKEEAHEILIEAVTVATTETLPTEVELDKVGGRETPPEKEKEEASDPVMKEGPVKKNEKNGKNKKNKNGKRNEKSAAQNKKEVAKKEAPSKEVAKKEAPSKDIAKKDVPTVLVQQNVCVETVEKDTKKENLCETADKDVCVEAVEGNPSPVVVAEKEEAKKDAHVDTVEKEMKKDETVEKETKKDMHVEVVEKEMKKDTCVEVVETDTKGNVLEGTANETKDIEVEVVEEKKEDPEAVARETEKEVCVEPVEKISEKGGNVEATELNPDSDIDSVKKETKLDSHVESVEKETKKNAQVVSVGKEASKDVQPGPVEKETKKKPEKKEPVNNKTTKRESSTKEDAVRRFEPSFTSSSESLKGPAKASIKPKEPLKPKDPAKSELSRSSSFEPMKSGEPVKKAESMNKVEPVKTAEDLSEPSINGHDDVIKQPTIIPVVKKKKGKGRFKEFDAKESTNDMLSAFVDAPPEPEKVVEKTPEPVKLAEKSPEDATWEDKESSIEKENLCGDMEDDAVVPKRVETKILKGEGSMKDAKHQYDREFLLKFQFAPICTSKPAGLPDIDIVLNEAHAPTKALVPGQRIQTANNDFMPPFMRQPSGGGSRNNSATGGRGNSRDKGGRGSQTNTDNRRQPKVISIPHLETKYELKKTENAWVRPSAVEKDMNAEEKALFEVNRNVRSILNKLTPQKFKPLVDQMIALKIDNSAKLESAISLIFEKAIAEPGFSVAYANMCRVLTDNFNKVPTSNEPNAPVVTFRKILLNKCQTEFEKENSDEKKLEEDRARTFDTEEEKKVFLLELDYREMMNRRRTLGNIRFIGELYKLKMISEPIMHDCIYKLLKAEKQESLEDQLECLCKLLSTIGKGLDHAKAKPRMDQYFDQMKKIIEKRKISSRIKFALKDVIDLRENDWVPRRDEGNPKTIDQIHREAQQKEKAEEQARQQEKIQKKLDPRGGGGGGGGGGRGGRDSPSVRQGAPQNVDGWNTVPNKSTRQVASAPVDASKLRFKKVELSSELSLGPGGRPGAWSKGASGGGSSRSGSGSNTPTTELDQRMNRYDALSDSSVAPSSLDHKGRSGTRQGMQQPRKGMGSSQQGSRNRNDRIDQNDALRAVRDMTGRGSRNQSPAPGSRNQSPAPRLSRNQSPAPREYENSSRGQTPTLPEPVSEDKMRKVTNSAVQEYLSCYDDREVMLCLKELQSPALHHFFVEECVTIVMEKKPEQRRGIGNLLRKMMREGLLDVPQVCKGLASVVELASDFAVDIPHIYKYLGEVIGPVVYDGTLPLNKVKDTIEPLIQENKAGIVMAESLSIAVQVAGNEEVIASLWANSKITWDKLLSKGDNVEQFIKDKKMGFTLKAHQSTSAHVSQSYSYQDILQILSRNSENINDELIRYIERNTKSSERNTAQFIQVLTTAVCSSTLSKDPSNNWECRKEILGKRKNILLKYIDGTKDLELQSLYALQQLAQDLKHPRGLLHTLFHELYQNDIISEETFFIWEISKDSPVGKGPAVSSVKDFLKWLRNADEESNDEDVKDVLSSRKADGESNSGESSVSPTNA